MTMNLLMPLLLVVVFIFFIILPQRKEKKALENMLANLKKGDKVLTSAGIYGEISALVDENRVTLKLGEGVKVDFAKSTITKVIAKEPAV